MRSSLLLLPVTLALTVTVAGCANALHLGPLRPPLPTSGASHVVVPAPAARTEPTPRVQLGIDMDFYAWPGMNVAAIAREDMAYVKHLHANSVSISFPFFMHGSRSSKVYTTNATPSPADLATLARYAEANGLYVSIRPLLDEHSLGTSRVHWTPAHPAAWFASYQKFLLPYARMAQAAHIPNLFAAAEFVQFVNSPHWAGLYAALRKVFTGTLSYSGGTKFKLSAQTIKATGAHGTVDAYPWWFQLSKTASQAQVSAAWDTYGRSLPRHVVISEVGIAAEPGAYNAPFQWKFGRKPLHPQVQVRWFTAACHAVAADHLGGVYFWVLTFGQSLTEPPTVRDPTAFVAGPGEHAIAACFQNLDGPAG